MVFPFIPDYDDKLNALCIDDTFYTYAYFRNRINAVSTELSLRNFKNTAVGVVASDHIDTYAAAMAIWATGNIYVPINPYHPSERIASIVAQAEIKLIIYSIDKIDSDVDSVLSVDLKEAAFNTIASPDDSDIAYILFTSGSTGQPKGVPVSYGNVRSFLRNLQTMNYQLGTGSRFLQMFDLSFDLSIVSILSPFIFRGTLFSVPNNNIKYPTIYRLLEEYEIEFAILVPSVVAYLKPYFDEIRLEKMKYMCLSGEAVPHNLTLEWKQCCPNAEFQNLYGPT